MSQIDELNEKSAALSVKLEKYQGLSNLLGLAEQWRVRIKEILAETSNKLENSATLASNIATNVAKVLSVLDQVSAQTKCFSNFTKETLGKVEQLTEVGKLFKLKYERRGMISKDQLSSEECGAFIAKLYGEMIQNGILLESEAHKLVAKEPGVDAEKLASMAQTKRDQALMNLAAVFDKESAALNDPVGTQKT